MIFKECRGYEGTLIFGQSPAQSLHAYDSITFTVAVGSYYLRINWQGHPGADYDGPIEVKSGTQVIPFGDQCR